MDIQELFNKWWNGDAMAVRANLAANDEEIAFTAFWSGFKAAQQSVQADGACTCANRHIGEDHICVNCGGVA